MHLICVQYNTASRVDTFAQILACARCDVVMDDNKETLQKSFIKSFNLIDHKELQCTSIAFLGSNFSHLFK